MAKTISWALRKQWKNTWHMAVNQGASMQERLKPFVEAINNLSDLTAKIVQDGAGRDIYRASVKVDGRKKPPRKSSKR